MASANFPNRPFRLEENIWLISQDIANNRSKVGYQLWIRKNSYSPSWTASTSSSFTMSLDGSVVASGNFSYDFRNSDALRLTNGETWITHNADGSKPSLPIKGTANVLTFGYTEVNSVGALPTIARASSPTFDGSATFDAGSTVRILMNRASTSFTHDVRWLFGTQSGTVANDVATGVDWTPSLSLLTQIPNNTSGNGTISVSTFNGSTLIGTRDLTFYLRAGSSIVPTVNSVTVVDQNSTVVSVVGALVQNLSNVKVTATSSGIQGSTIKETEITVAGTPVASGKTILITKAGSNPVVAKVTDSRGRTGSRTQATPALAYTNPTVSRFEVIRSNAAGVAQDDGAYLRYDLTAAVASLVNGSEKNGMTITIKTRPTSGSWSTRNTITTGLSYATGAVITGGAVFPVSSSFDVQVTVTDKVGRSYVAQTTVATALVALDLNGKSVGIGKFHERGVLDVGGDTYINGNLNVSGNYSGNISNSSLYQLSEGLTLTGGAIGVKADLNTVTATGFYGATASAANTPTGGAIWNIQVINNGGRSTQYATRSTAMNKTYKRWLAVAGDTTSWTPWAVSNDESDTGWVALTLLSGWSYYATESAYYRTVNGFTYLTGRVTGTTAAGATIARLPTTSRHAMPVGPVFAGHSDNGTTAMVTKSNGDITIATRAGMVRQGVSLAGISFPTG